MPKRKRKPLVAFVFCCNDETEQECIDRSLFGGRDGLWNNCVGEIVPGTPLLLYNVDSKICRGPYHAASEADEWEPDAWNGEFNVQVKVQNASTAQCRSFVVNPRQLRLNGKLTAVKYEKILNDHLSPPPKKRLAAFVFCCNDETEQECFDRALFGGYETGLVRQGVGFVEPGCPLLLYNTDSKKLRGPYFAASTAGNHVPNAWGGRFSAQIKIDASQGWKDVREVTVDTSEFRINNGKLNKKRYLKISRHCLQFNPIDKLSTIRKLAGKMGLVEVSCNLRSCVAAFKNGDDAPVPCKFEIYFTTGTVKTCINHPRLGKTQLFRRNVGLDELKAIFENPRRHTKKGYRRR